MIVIDDRTREGGGTNLLGRQSLRSQELAIHQHRQRSMAFLSQPATHFLLLLEGSVVGRLRGAVAH